jgi:hypothetical protein
VSSSARTGLLRGATGRLRSSLERTLTATSVPYGYTVTIWVCGAYLVRNQGDGFPGVGIAQGFAFAAGALLGFAVLAALSGRLLPHAAPAGEALDAEVHHPLFAAGFHILAMGLAMPAAMLAARWLGDAAWFLTPFLATSVYLAVASAELALALELSRRNSFFARGSRRQPVVSRAVERGGPPPP